MCKCARERARARALVYAIARAHMCACMSARDSPGLN